MALEQSGLTDPKNCWRGRFRKRPVVAQPPFLSGAPLGHTVEINIVRPLTLSCVNSFPLTSRFHLGSKRSTPADGYEICFVEAVAFYQLAEPKYDVIDFAARATRGGDGAAPPKSEKLQHAAGVTAAVTTPEEVEEAVAAAGGDLILLDFGAG